MSNDNNRNDHSLAAVVFVSVCAITAVTICFLASHGFNFSGTVEKEKIEVTAHNSNLTSNE